MEFFHFLPPASRSANRVLRILGGAAFLSATLCLITCVDTASAAVRTAVAGTPAASHPLTPAQWKSLLRDAAKRISTLHLQAHFRRQFYVSPAEARQVKKLLRRGFPEQSLGAYHAQAGRVVRSQLINFDWGVSTGWVNARMIQIGGAVDFGSRGRLHKGRAHASIWVVGRRFYWQAFPGGGVWNVTIGRRSGSWFTSAWPYEFRDLGLFDISVYWVPFATPIVPANGIAKLPLSYRLASQKIDRSTGLIRLRYLQLYKGKVNRVPGVGTCEYLYVLRLAGGLRVYRKVYEAVGGPKGTVRFFEADFGKFVKSGGVWFPTHIHECTWPNGARRAQPDETITIKNVVVNGTFPPHTFRYEPPFGAMVTDARTKPPSIYFVGSKNPKFPPTTAPASQNKGGGKK
jgi:hypothetical protein